MSLKILWNFSLQVVSGPKITEAKEVDVDAYELIDFQLAADETAKEVTVQPGDEEQVQLFLIKSTVYDENISYSINAEEADAANRVKLDSFQVLPGKGLIQLYGSSPQKLFFYNLSGQAASIQIFTGREAI